MAKANERVKGSEQTKRGKELFYFKRSSLTFTPQAAGSMVKVKVPPSLSLPLSLSLSLTHARSPSSHCLSHPASLSPSLVCVAYVM